MKKLILLIVTISLLSSYCGNNINQGQNPQRDFKNGMVVTAHPEATKIGLETLKKGGNAVDAAVSVGFALAVSLPSAGNIGGGGFMVIRFANGTSTSLDYREKAPMLASRDMYLDKKGDIIPDLSLYSHLASGVPGSVDGLIRAHAKYGKLKFVDLIQPAIDLAENGFPLTEAQAKDFNRLKVKFEKANANQTAFTKNTEWKKGDLFIQKELAKTLCLIRDFGRDGFYAGTTADLIVKEMQRGGGLISKDDLKNYESKWREPIIGNYKGHKIISMGSPSSGGIVLMQLLQMIEPYPIKAWGFQSAQSIHLIVEAERRAYADRSEFLGDADFWKVPVKQLLDAKYVKTRILDFNSDKASISTKIKHGNIAPESEYTTHYSIVDKWNNAVSTTTTINDSYGTKIVVAGAGFILNNEMDDFSSKPGVPNYYGLLGNDANAIMPNKRPLSAMTPTIVEKDGKLLMVVGTPGGSTIITSVLQTILNVLEYEMDMQKAVSSKRFHHQWLPDQISVEDGAFSSNLIEELQKKGHKIAKRGQIGRVDAILVKPNGSFEGGADPRGDDCWMGF